MMATGQPNKSKKAEEKKSLRSLTETFLLEEEQIRTPAEKGKKRQEKLGRMLARDRIQHVLDEGADFFEVGLWAGHGMYEEWGGGVAAAGTIAGIGRVMGRECMIVANDATVKAGAFFPQTVKKVLRAQRIAYRCRLPVIFLVDSSGVFLPLQDEIFPDEDDFGRIFRNNAIFSAAGIPQIAAVMGNCIAGGGYLPVLCDKLIMTEGSGLYLAGPALVKAAIGQEVDTEELGGAKMHAEISGTVDYVEPNDAAALQRVRQLIDLLPPDRAHIRDHHEVLANLEPDSLPLTERDSQDLYDIVPVDGRTTYDVRDVLTTLVDQGSLSEYKADYGKTLVTAYAKIGGLPVGIVANQRTHSQSKRHGIEIGGVIYADSADKAARFVMDCNQSKVPLIFLQDVTGFMVGRDAEQSGIIRCGAKLVNAISNSIVPKITIVIGSSFGAGNYALCGKAYDPDFILAWPNAKYAVMGADQAADTLFQVQKKAAEQAGAHLSNEELEAMRSKIHKRYQETVDVRYGAARGWVDALIAPHETRKNLLHLLHVLRRAVPPSDHFHTGVFQV